MCDEGNGTTSSSCLDTDDASEENRVKILSLIVGGIVLGTILLVVCLTCALYWSCRRESRDRKTIEKEEKTIKSLQDALRDKEIELWTQRNELKLYSDAWLLEWSDVSLHRVIAKGGYGEVWHGVFRGKIEVAVKKMLDTENKSLSEDTEIHFLQRTRHPRLVMFFGAGRMPDKSLFLVLEYMNLGALSDYLENHAAHRDVSWSIRLNVIMDVAEGMEYVICSAITLSLILTPPPSCHTMKRLITTIALYSTQISARET